jgi:hypothetical protein
VIIMAPTLDLEVAHQVQFQVEAQQEVLLILEEVDNWEE